MTTPTKKAKLSASITQTNTSQSTKATKTTKTTRIKQRSPKKTKKQVGLELLKRSQGATLSDLQKALGWQVHSVRGFLAGTAKKEPDFRLHSEKPDNQLRRYRLAAVESE